MYLVVDIDRAWEPRLDQVPEVQAIEPIDLRYQRDLAGGQIDVTGYTDPDRSHLCQVDGCAAKGSRDGIPNLGEHGLDPRLLAGRRRTAIRCEHGPSKVRDEGLDLVGANIDTNQGAAVAANDERTSARAGADGTDGHLGGLFHQSRFDQVSDDLVDRRLRQTRAPGNLGAREA
jgi:hypothetical protein